MKEFLNEKVQNKVNYLKGNYVVKENNIYTLDGEYIGDKFRHDLDIKYTDKQKEYFKSKAVLSEHEKENGGFVFLFYKTLQNINEYLPNLNKSDLTRLLYLTTYVSYEDNKIVYDNGRKIDDNELMKLIKYGSKKRFNEFINKLIENKYISICDEGYYYLSYKICKYGKLNKSIKNSDINYMRLFRKTIRDLFDNCEARQLGRLSIIYEILPFVSLERNTVCHNPLENNVDDLIPMSLKELCNKLGYAHEQRFRQMLYDCKLNDRYVFGFFMTDGDKSNMKVVINPKIMCAGDYDSLQYINMLFTNSIKK